MDLSPEELQLRASHIQVLVNVVGESDGLARLFGVANTGDPASAEFFTTPQLGHPVEEMLAVIGSLFTTHAMIGEDRFEPTLLEVLTQIPSALSHRVRAVSVVGRVRIAVYGNGPESPQTGERWAGEVFLYGQPEANRPGIPHEPHTPSS